MKRKILIALFALGTIGGFGSGFAHLRWAHRHHRQAWEHHVAKVCTDAARESSRDSANAPAPSPPRETSR
jgi:hypothetical protein